MNKLSRSLRQYKYEMAAFINGLVIMVLELVGVRIVAPHFGSSIYVWTAVIGVILGALSIGYWYGGKMADRQPSDSKLAIIILIGCLVLILTKAAESSIMNVITLLTGLTRPKAVFAALALFGPINLVLGVVSPYLARLKISSLKRAGEHVGRIYALGTVGSIAGTFLCGFWLLELFGSRQLALVMAGLLVINSLVLSRKKLWPYQLGLIIFIVMIYRLNLGASSSHVMLDTESAYARYQITKSQYRGSPAIFLQTEHRSVQSGVYADGRNELLIDYIARMYKLTDVINHPSRILIIGGGAYTLAGYIADHRPDSSVEAVEIDPKLNYLAERYFFYRPRSNLTIINQDGREFLNQAKGKYDLILIDAFNGSSPPFQLATIEAIDKIKGILKYNGLVGVNIMASLEGNRARFTQAQLATYQQVFGFADIYQLLPAFSRREVQNNLLISGSSRDLADVAGIKLGLENQSSRVARGLVLRDDYAPIEQWVDFDR